MAEMKVTFTLSARDQAHLRRVMRRASAAARGRSEDSVIKAAQVMAEEVRKFKPPAYVSERVARLETLISLLRDPDYEAPGPVRRKVLGALAYFTDPDDLIADPIPGLGFLDDAIMIELVSRDLRHELAAYADYCRLRDRLARTARAHPERNARRLAQRRSTLRARVQAREARDAAATPSAGDSLL